MSSFNTGLGALQSAIAEAEKRAEAAKSGNFGGSLGYFTWKNGESRILRFLTDDIITADFYDFIVDKTGKTKNFMVDPADPDRLQRYMSPTPGIGWKKEFKSGALVEPTPRKLGVGVAVEREEVRGPDGKLVLEDKRTEDGGRYFGIVQQSVTNFWHTLATSVFKRYGTICDRDFEIERQGDGFNTKYSIVPTDVDPDLNSVEAVHQFYFYGQPWDKNDPQANLKCPQTLQQWAEYFSGEERYKFWLTPDDETPAWLRTGVSLAGAAAPTGGSGLDEFKASTTQNPDPTADEAQVSAPAATSFGSLKDTLLNPNKQ